MGGADWSSLEAALVNSAEGLVERHSGSESWNALLGKLTVAAAASVPGASYVGMTMRDDAQGLVSLAPSHAEIVQLDRSQAELGEGPCVTALQPGESAVIEVTDFSRDERWPRFARAATGAGVRSLLSHSLAPRGAAPGAVNFYSRDLAAFSDPAAHAIAGAFAMQAAIAVYGAGRVTDLNHALQTRDIIGQAKGILMERFRLDDQRAFDLLVTSSQETNMKLVDVARWLTDEVAGRDSRAPRPAPHG